MNDDVQRPQRLGRVGPVAGEPDPVPHAQRRARSRNAYSDHCEPTNRWIILPQCKNDRDSQAQFWKRHREHLMPLPRRKRGDQANPDRLRQRRKARRRVQQVAPARSRREPIEIDRVGNRAHRNARTQDPPRIFGHRLRDRHRPTAIVELTTAKGGPSPAQSGIIVPVPDHRDRAGPAPERGPSCRWCGPNRAARPATTAASGRHTPPSPPPPLDLGLIETPSLASPRLPAGPGVRHGRRREVGAQRLDRRRNAVIAQAPRRASRDAPL